MFVTKQLQITDQGRFYCPSRDRDARSYSKKRIYMNLEYDGAMNVKEIILGDSSYGVGELTKIEFRI